MALRPLRRFAKEDFDVIIMDIMMPDLDGFVATRRIKKYEGHSGGDAFGAP